MHQPQSKLCNLVFRLRQRWVADLFVASYFFSVDETIRSYLGLPTSAGTMKLYRNLGNGTFEDVTTKARLNK